jgi:hypothetical protein
MQPIVIHIVMKSLPEIFVGLHYIERTPSTKHPLQTFSSANGMLVTVIHLRALSQLICGNSNSTYAVDRLMCYSFEKT